jgi:hypothetical protein
MLALLILLAAPQAADPLAPARAGMVQCYAPDTAAKTCRSIAGYTQQADGSYLNTAKVLIAPDQRITVETVSSVRIKNGAVCGIVLRKDLLAGKVSVGGTVMPPDRAGTLLSRIAGALEPSGMLDKEICTAYIPDGDGLRAEVTLGGVARPDFAQTVIWVGANDGYSVGTP